MKRLLTLIALLPLLAFGQGQVPSGTSLARIGYNGQLIGSVIGATGLAAPTSYLLEENFEGAGTPSSWTTSGTVDFDATDVVLQGSQSLKLDGTSTDSYANTATWSYEGTVYGYFLYRVSDALPSSAEALVVRLYDSTFTTLLGRLVITTAGSLKMYHGTAATTIASALSDNTAYHIWFEYAPGSGANGAYAFGWSTDGTKPTLTSGSNGTATAYCRGLRIYADNTSEARVTHVDRVLVDDASIGSNP